nr:MAG TPA: hypothetical protein [Caudoviricetes sp.]
MYSFLNSSFYIQQENFSHRERTIARGRPAAIFRPRSTFSKFLFSQSGIIIDTQ